MSMRICLMTPTFLPLVGGAEKDADMIVTGLRRRGHDVRVLAQKPPRGLAEPALDYPVTRYLRMPAHHLWAEQLCLPIWRLHRRWPFEIALPLYSYPIGYAAGLLKRRLGYKLLMCPQGGDLYPKFHMWPKPRVARIIREGYRQADQIIAISQWMAGRVKEVLGDPTPPTQVVYNGIDLQDLDAQSAQSASHRPDFELPDRFILHLARVAPVKRQTLAVEAVSRIAGKLRQLGAAYVIVGDGSDLPPIRQRVESQGLGDVIRLLGTRNGLDKSWLYNRATVMISTSREEAFGNVIIEAMAHGLPMLGSDIPTHHELIAGRGWGELFRQDDPDDLGQAILRMLTGDLAAYRRQALAIRDEFALSRMIDGYERLCQQVLEA